jgi:transposase
LLRCPSGRRWAKNGVFETIFQALSADADFEYVIIDGTIVRVHQHGTRARGDSDSGHWTLAGRADDEDCRARRCAGQSGAFCPATGAATRQAGVAPLLHDLAFDALLADKAFDSNALRADLDERGAVAVIPPRSNEGLTD